MECSFAIPFYYWKTCTVETCTDHKHMRVFEMRIIVYFAEYSIFKFSIANYFYLLSEQFDPVYPGSQLHSPVTWWHVILSPQSHVSLHSSPHVGCSHSVSQNFPFIGKKGSLLNFVVNINNTHILWIVLHFIVQ